MDKLKDKKPEIPEKGKNEVKKSNLHKKLVESKIITEEELKFLQKEVFETGTNKINLIYRLSSKNGFSAKKFHNKCDDKSNTFFICESDKGKKFGGINYLDWSKESVEKITDKNMLFSLSHLKTLPLRMNESGENINTRLTSKTIYYKSNCGPIMGDGDLIIGDKCNKKESCSSDIETYQLDGDYDSETFLAGAAKFKIETFYIYQFA